jgi:hypothetical protein
MSFSHGSVLSSDSTNKALGLASIPRSKKVLSVDGMRDGPIGCSMRNVEVLAGTASRDCHRAQ